jgi:hypothetical protein
MSVIIHDNTPVLLERSVVNGALAIKRALDDAKRLSRPKTPYSGVGKHGAGSGGHLRDSVLTQVLGLHGKIVWDKVYAQFQERGRRVDGSHKVKNYTTSGTGTKFAEDTMREINKGRTVYLRGLLR